MLTVLHRAVAPVETVVTRAVSATVVMVAPGGVVRADNLIPNTPCHSLKATSMVPLAVRAATAVWVAVRGTSAGPGDTAGAVVRASVTRKAAALVGQAEMVEPVGTVLRAPMLERAAPAT